MPANPPLIPFKEEIWFYKTGEDYDIFSNVTDIGFTMNIDGEPCKPSSSEAVYQAVKCLSNGGASPKDKEIAQKLLQQSGKQFNPSEPIPIVTKGVPGIMQASNTAGGWIQKMAGGLPGFNNSAIHDSYNATNYQHTDYQFCNGKTEFDKFKQISVKEQLMYETLLCKFTQNPSLLKALLDTYPNKIVENTSLANYNDPTWGNGLDGHGRNALGFALMRVREDLNKERNTPPNGILIRTGISDELADALQLKHSLKPTTPEYITTQELDSVPACTTVAALKSSSNPLQAKVSNIKFPTPKTDTAPPSPPQPYEDHYFNSKTTSSDTHGNPIERVLDKLNGISGCTGFKVSDNPTDKAGDKKASPSVFKFRFDSEANAKKFCIEKLNNDSKPIHAIPPDKPKHFSVFLTEQDAQELFKKMGIETHGRTAGYSMVDAVKHHLEIDTYDPDAAITSPSPLAPLEDPASWPAPLPTVTPQQPGLIQKCDWTKISGIDAKVNFTAATAQETNTDPTYLGHISTQGSTDKAVIVKTDSLECLTDDPKAIVAGLKLLVDTAKSTADKDTPPEPLVIEANNAFSEERLSKILKELAEQKIPVKFQPCEGCSENIKSLIETHNASLPTTTKEPTVAAKPSTSHEKP